MDTELFNLFSECFENSNNLYDYMGPNKYNMRNIVVLLNELKNKYSQLNSYTSGDDFYVFIKSQFLGEAFIQRLKIENPGWIGQWNRLKDNLLEVNLKLIDIVNQCINEDRILWVIGY
jgi:hypothetical protein